MRPGVTMREYMLLISVIACATFTIGLFIYLGVTSVDVNRTAAVITILEVVEVQAELDEAIGALASMQLLLANMDTDLMYERGRLTGIEDSILLMEYEHGRTLSRLAYERDSYQLELEYLNAILSAEGSDYYLLLQIEALQTRLYVSNDRINELEDEFNQSLTQIEEALQPYRDMIDDLTQTHEQLQGTIQQYQHHLQYNQEQVQYLQGYLENLDRYMALHNEHFTSLYEQLNLLRQEHENITAEILATQENIDNVQEWLQEVEGG